MQQNLCMNTHFLYCFPICACEYVLIASDNLTHKPNASFILNYIFYILDITYLDHAGATLYSNEQLDKYMVDLKNNLYGNPHSSNQTSDLASDVIHQVKFV